MNDKTIDQSIVKLPSVKVGLGTLFTLGLFSATLCSSAFWLYADKRNGETFVTKESYNKDQNFKQEQYTKDQVYLQTSVAEIKKGQEEMQRDIKQLIKNSPNR